MKQGTQFVLPVEIGLDLDSVSRIEFVFKQRSCKGFPAIKTNTWQPAGGAEHHPYPLDAGGDIQIHGRRDAVHGHANHPER